MPRRKPSQDDMDASQKLAAEMIEFRKSNLFTQKALAEVLDLSRRTIQMVESGTITPHPGTLKAWRELVERYQKNRY